MEEERKEMGVIPLEINVELKELPEEQEWPNIAAYVFSRSGRLLDKQPIKPGTKKPTTGRAEFELKEKHDLLVVKIGPDVEDAMMLKKYQPAVDKVLVTPEKKKIEFKLVKPLWLCWLKVPYHVTGNVVKQEGGRESPICAGEVEIYDVDIMYCLLRIPDPVIERIREGIIDGVVDPLPIEIEEIPSQLVHWDWDDDDYCGTVPKGPFPPPRVDVIKKLEALPPAWAFSKQRFEALPTARARMSTSLKAMPLVEKRTLLNTEVAEGVKVSQVLYTNTAQFRNLLIEKFQAFRFWLCWWPWIHWLWWPYCGYNLEKLGTAELQPDGSFSKTVWLSICRHDTPDLWFVVRQNINGVERVIYARHPVPCNTYWNHPSGKPVHLAVTDPSAIACHQQIPGIPDPYVMPMGIYDEDEWYEIHQAHIKAPCVPGTPLPSKCGLYKETDPYGTRLDFRMQFHDGLRNLLPPGNGVMYYRWSYRKHGDTDWTHIDTPIIHRYLTAIASDKHVIDSEKLGPNTIGSEDSLFSVPDPNKSWLNNRNDLAFAIWNTAKWNGSKYIPRVPDGKYDLRLEMFVMNGNKLKPLTAGFKYTLPTGPVGPVDDALYVEPDGSLILHLHVDNKDTVAEIMSVALNGAKAKECQFLEYQDKSSDTVDIEYVAYHPTTSHNFLDHYDLTIRRGISGTAVDSIHPTTPAPTPITKPFDVIDLLGSYDQCAFAVWLHTWPRTRDGHSPIRAYEDSDTSAFALVKKEIIK